jgi:hypothetical protein
MVVSRENRAKYKNTGPMSTKCRGLHIKAGSTNVQ